MIYQSLALSLSCVQLYLPIVSLKPLHVVFLQFTTYKAREVANDCLIMRAIISQQLNTLDNLPLSAALLFCSIHSPQPGYNSHQLACWLLKI